MSTQERKPRADKGTSRKQDTMVTRTIRITPEQDTYLNSIPESVSALLRDLLDTHMQGDRSIKACKPVFVPDKPLVKEPSMPQSKPEPNNLSKYDVPEPVKTSRKRTFVPIDEEFHDAVYDGEFSD